MGILFSFVWLIGQFLLVPSLTRYMQVCCVILLGCYHLYQLAILLQQGVQTWYYEILHWMGGNGHLEALVRLLVTAQCLLATRVSLLAENWVWRVVLG